jgi:DNA modification methylase
MLLMNTLHKLIIGPAQQMKAIQDSSVQLVVTSPPYPMIEMWDQILSEQNPAIKTALESGKGQLAFELIHQELDQVWLEIKRVLIPGGFACINIGDATRTVANEFALFPNHSRIISAFLSLGFSNLPNIIWRKQTNAPNKFMGSGMLPAGAYITLEHEWILVFRKGGKRVFLNEAEKQLRKESAFFWEERNIWFSDLWDLKGVRQRIDNPETRKRSAAYPFEIPYRLINMYSVKGDTVLDPFLGTGTTTMAAMVTERNSIGIEIDPGLVETLSDLTGIACIGQFNKLIGDRIRQHEYFLAERAKDHSRDGLKHFNANLNLPVVTIQEMDMVISYIRQIERAGDHGFLTFYAPTPLELPTYPDLDKTSTQEL